MKVQRIELTVNDEVCEIDVEPRRLLADVLRQDLELFATHLGCEHGVCGACTVLVDGEAVRSCCMLAVQADGTVIETADGLASDGELHPIQQAFWQEHGLQCGFCTPGFMMATLELLRRHPDPSEEAIRDYLAGNICRCTGYVHIVRAVRSAASAMTSS